MAAIVFVWWNIACGGDGNSVQIARAGPVVQLLDSVKLGETDSLFLALPVAMAIAPEDGSSFVSDAASGHVLQFASDGELVRAFGGPGEGPGELAAAGGVFLVAGNLIVEDLRRRVMHVFAVRDGRYVRSVRFTGNPTYFIESQSRDTVWFGIRDDTRRTAVAMWVFPRDTLDAMTELPNEYVEFSAIGLGRITGLPVVHWNDTLLVGFGPLNGLIVHPLAGGDGDTLEIPVRERRGSTRETIERAGADFAALMHGISALNAMHRLPSGEVALVHYDHTVHGQDVPRITATLYVSLLDRGLRRACVDARVPLESDSRPVVQFRLDTLFVLHQEVDEQRTTASAWLTKYSIRAEGCDWLPVARGQPLLK